MSSSSTSEVTESSPPSNEDIVVWADRIRTIQMDRATPEIRQRIAETSERQARAKEAAKRCYRLERCNYVSSASNVSALSTWDAAQRAPMAQQREIFSVRAQMQSAQTATLRNIMKSSVGPSVRSPQFDVVQPMGESSDEDEADVALNALEHEVVSSSATPIMSSTMILQQPARAVLPPPGVDMVGPPPVPTPADNVSSNLASLLRQLAREPTDEAEMAAKFNLFETFLGTVGAIRETTLEFWEENKHVFVEGTMRTAAEREVQGIDRPECSQIYDDPSKWFVYGMLAKANENSVSISRLLASLRTRLELLSQAPGDCPICLEVIPPTNCTTLSCAHKVCSDCWRNYSAMVASEGHPLLCPLCRHEEFVVQLVATSNRRR